MGLFLLIAFIILLGSYIVGGESIREDIEGGLKALITLPGRLWRKE